MSTDTKEKAFQQDIINYLESTGYTVRSTKDYHVKSFLDVGLVLKFIKTSQPDAWEIFANHNANPETTFIKTLCNKIRERGTIRVLREGINEMMVKFDLFYPKPNTSLNPDLEIKFSQNIFSVVKELEYEDKDNGNRLDLVIFINGIPISTIELKDTFTQGVEKAMDQYRYDRDPNEQLFKNCLVHFAMSDENIQMTTKLAGEKTRFLPFNKGITNPVVDGYYKTSYLYTEILQKNQLSRLINDFIFDEKIETKGKKKKTDKVTIFPRFHQLDCVNTLLDNPQQGHNYLVQHSAGSGKTKTIAWLAHGLVNKFDENNKRVYDMIFVISDRKVIDKQLQDQVKAIEKKKDLVQKIEDNSKQLAEAIKSGTNIVVSTIHKFSWIVDEIADVEDRTYAIIVDEAHSSQSGSYASDVRRGLTSAEVDSGSAYGVEDDADADLYEQMEKRRRTPNLSFFAFTATPKQKTLEQFGRWDETFEEYRPHHLYSMKQAIKEGFILDVLEYYITYPTYFKLVQTADEDNSYSKDKAMKVLKKYVEQHPHSIKKKTAIMLNHFMSSTIKKIDNKAKAMLVTSSRKEAVLYKLEFDRQIQENKFNIKTLVAFTSTIKLDGLEYTESNMNKIEGKKSIKEAFKEDAFKILIVANKFQTGFDEPLLHTMYVDKKLSGVAAVQTLSRVNRIAPNKTNTLIIDFVNKKEEIREAFEPYYTETYLTGKTDYHKLYDLMENIYDFDLFYEDQVNEFYKSYYDGVPQATLHNLLDSPIQKFEKLDKEYKVQFKKKIRKYQSVYSFMSQLLPFSDLRLEKLFIYLKFLSKKLPTINEPLPFNVLEDVDMDSYKIDTRDEGTKITLDDGDGGLDPIISIDVQYKPDEEEKLSIILDKLNEMFKADFQESDNLILKQLADGIRGNEELNIKAQKNKKENLRAVFDDYFNDELMSVRQNNKQFFSKINSNSQLRNELKNYLLDLLYEDQAEKV